MASVVSIANAAFLKLGTSGITSLTDHSPNARAFNDCYERLRDAELRAQPWKFATKRGTIGQLTEAPAWGYAHQYRLPADYLALVEINDYWCWQGYGSRGWGSFTVPWDEAVYRIEGKNLLTRMGPTIDLRWVYRAENAGDFEPLFVEALACRLAKEMSMRLLQSDSAGDRLLRDYNIALSKAQRIDAIERAPEPIRDTSWIIARL